MQKRGATTAAFLGLSVVFLIIGIGTKNSVFFIMSIVIALFSILYVPKQEGGNGKSGG